MAAAPARKVLLFTAIYLYQVGTVTPGIGLAAKPKIPEAVTLRAGQNALTP
jgi:hypothetical protein